MSPTAQAAVAVVAFFAVAITLAVYLRRIWMVTLIAAVVVLLAVALVLQSAIDSPAAAYAALGLAALLAILAYAFGWLPYGPGRRRR
jgi:hypothetical protein